MKPNLLRISRTADGTYYAVSIIYPHVVYPDSFGTLEHAMTYIASRYALTLDEYRRHERRVKSKGYTLQVNEREKEMLVCALQTQQTMFEKYGVDKQAIDEYWRLFDKIAAIQN